MTTPGDRGEFPPGDNAESEPPPGLGPQALSLEAVEQAGDWSAAGPLDCLVARVARAIAASPALALGAASPAEACVAFGSDAEVQALNAGYRGKDRPTNVLSFPAAPMSAMTEGEPRNLGDIILAAGTVAAEAHEQGISLADHIQHLVVHGVLHLLGFDHENDADAEAMEAEERRILASLGVADPYSDIH